MALISTAIHTITGASSEKAATCIYGSFSTHQVLLYTDAINRKRVNCDWSQTEPHTHTQNNCNTAPIAKDGKLSSTHLTVDRYCSLVRFFMDCLIVVLNFTHSFPWNTKVIEWVGNGGCNESWQCKAFQWQSFPSGSEVPVFPDAKFSGPKVFRSQSFPSQSFPAQSFPVAKFSGRKVFQSQKFSSRRSHKSQCKRFQLQSFPATKFSSLICTLFMEEMNWLPQISYSLLVRPPLQGCAIFLAYPFNCITPTLT